VENHQSSGSTQLLAPSKIFLAAFPSLSSSTCSVDSGKTD
jgi:hypothetical protein